MRKLILILPIAMFMVSSKFYTITPVDRVGVSPIDTIEPIPIEVEIEEPEFEVPTYTLDVQPLIEAMIMVESRGNDSAYSKKEEAVGCLQIRPIMVREVNRILEIQKSDLRYTLDDRWSREKSIEMFHIVNGYHNKNSTYEEIARAWNGGPNWAEKSLTKRYWKRVQKQLKKQEKNERSNTEFPEV